MQADYRRAGKKVSMVCAKLNGTSELFQDLPANATITMIKDGKKGYLTFQNTMTLIEGDDEPLSFLPYASELKDYRVALLAPQTVDGTTVDPIVLISDDNVERTYFIEEKTYRLVQMLFKDSTQGDAMQSKIVFTNEALNPKFSPDTFKLVPPANTKQETVHLNASNPIALAFAVMALNKPK